MNDRSFNGDVDDDQLERYILSYIGYYKFVIHHSQFINLIDFEELINRPFNTLLTISNSFEKGSEISEDKYKKTVKAYRGTTSTLGSSKPNAVKEKCKKIIKSHIMSNEKYMTLIRLEKKLKTLTHA
jgi:hypothetical protein